MTRYTHRRADLLARGVYTDRTKARVRNRANLYLDGELFGRIQEIALDEEASVSTVIRELVRDALAARDLKRASPTVAGANT